MPTTTALVQQRRYPESVASQRRTALLHLGDEFRTRYAQSLAMTAQARASISDLAFTGRYRVPFQYSPLLREHLQVGAFLRASEGVQVEDLDGNRLRPDRLVRRQCAGLRHVQGLHARGRPGR